MVDDLFSRRYGYVPGRSIIQLDSIDEELRVELWNIIYVLFFSGNIHTSVDATGADLAMLRAIWRDFFRAPLDDMHHWVSTFANQTKEWVVQGDWFRVYDLLDLLVKNAVFEPRRQAFINQCNDVLAREVSGYRFVNNRISPVATATEAAAIDQALLDSQPIAPVHTHLARALDLLADRQSPDYRNSIKESISAVEALCVLIAAQPKASLGTALSAVEKRVALHGALKGAFNQLYGYTSDASGIRHALLEQSDLELADAQFMLVACSGFVTYLLAKVVKAGLSF
jgi:hypothetical protein